jgi:hypothetical protein
LVQPAVLGPKMIGLFLGSQSAHETEKVFQHGQSPNQNISSPGSASMFSP